MLIGCEDGSICAFRDQFETDDGSEVDAWAVLGPYTPNPAGTSRMTSIQFILPKRSGDVDIQVQAFNTAEEAYDQGLSAGFRGMLGGGQTRPDQGTDKARSIR